MGIYISIYLWSTSTSRLAQSVEHSTLNRKAEGSSPSLGARVLTHSTFCFPRRYQIDVESSFHGESYTICYKATVFDIWLITHNHMKYITYG